MIAQLKPYSATKDSGVEWLGEVPAHWQVPRLKNWLGVNERILPEDTNPDYTFNYLDIGSVEAGRTNARSARIRFGDSPSRARRVVRSGDTIVSTVRTYLKAVWHATDACVDQIASTGFVVLTPRGGTIPRFVSYFCQSDPFTNCVTAESVGIAYPAIAGTKLETLEVCVPPFPEQSAIARFLDRADHRIQRYIRAKEKLITLLEEQKQAIIHQAVTGQIDVRTGQPYPAYRDSGVAWLGRAPKSWKILPLQRITLDRCDGPFGSGLKSLHYVDEGIRVVRLKNIGHGEFNDADAAFISREHYATLGDHSVEPGDVLIAGLGDPNHPSGRACVAPKHIKPAMVKADCFRFRLNSAICYPKFLALQLTTTSSTASAILSTGATRQRTSLRTTLARIVGIPSIHEQTLIAEFIGARVSQINSARRAAEKEIILLQKYRTRLIADVVTGKLDVREAAAALPKVDPFADEDEVDDSPDTGNAPAVDQDQQPAGIAD